MKNNERIDLLFEILRAVIGLLLAYGVAFLFISLIAEDPAEAAITFMTGPFSNKLRFGQMMAKFIVYILMGCGMCFIYAGGRFSLMGEGTFIFSACVATCFLQIAKPGLAGFPKIIMITILLAIGGAAGGVINLIPAISREKLKVNELVISIMMNYVLLFGCTFVLKVYLKDRALSYLASEVFPENCKFSRIIQGTQFHTGIIVAAIAVIVSVIIYYKSCLGAEIRISGSAPEFARYSGINMVNTLMLTQVIGGVFFGIGGIVDCFATYDRYQYGALTNYGFDGLMVAVLARKKPLYIPAGAFLLAYIRTSAAVLNVTSNLPIEFVYIMQAIVIMFVAAEEFLGTYKNKVIFKYSMKEAGKEGGQ